jgi:hypothetical protein
MHNRIKTININNPTKIINKTKIKKLSKANTKPLTKIVKNVIINNKTNKNNRQFKQIKPNHKEITKKFNIKSIITHIIKTQKINKNNANRIKTITIQQRCVCKFICTKTIENQNLVTFVNSSQIIGELSRTGL